MISGNTNVYIRSWKILIRDFGKCKWIVQNHRTCLFIQMIILNTNVYIWSCETLIHDFEKNSSGLFKILEHVKAYKW